MSPRRSNLPRKISSFVGRNTELAELSRLLTGNRLVAVTGPGGSGKTRLVLELCHGLAGLPDGVWVVDLAALSDQQLVPATVADQLEVVDVATADGSRWRRPCTSATRSSPKRSTAWVRTGALRSATRRT